MSKLLSAMDRLCEIARYDLANPALRTNLDQICQKTAKRLGQPIALVTIVLNDAQFFAGGYGVDDGWAAEAGGSPAEWAFCAQMVRTGEPYVSSDLTKDPLQQENPLVLHEGLRSYAGAPLVTPGGHVLGGHCVLGAEPHEFGAAEVEVLRKAAAETTALIREFPTDNGR